MARKSHNKIVAVGIVMIFLCLILLPAMNAQDSIGKIKTVENECICNDESNYDLLIIAPKRFNLALRPLVNHKSRMGVSAKLVTLNKIYREMSDGRDNAEKIKFFIKNAVEEWDTKYVLLIGGRKNQFSSSENWWLPVRYINTVDIWSAKPAFWEPEFMSDLYYADIYDSEGNFSNWDTDYDGIFGEWLDNNSAEDVLDLHPDVYVGRLPCRNIFQVMTVVRKIIVYEKNTYGEEWFKRMVVVAGDADPSNDIYDGEVATERAIENMSGFDYIRLWTSLGTLTGPADVIYEINEGCGFLYLCGHGSPAVWATHPPKSEEWISGLSLGDMSLLSNRRKLPICVVGGCHNSLFNVSIARTSWAGDKKLSECWSWRLTRKMNGGSIATIGNTAGNFGAEHKIDPSKGGGSDWLEVYFFEEYGQNNTDILGETWGKAINSYLQDFPINWSEGSFNDTAIDAKTVEQWVLFGDPSLKIGGYP